MARVGRVGEDPREEVGVVECELYITSHLTSARHAVTKYRNAITHSTSEQETLLLQTADGPRDELCHCQSKPCELVHKYRD